MGRVLWVLASAAEVPADDAWPASGALLLEADKDPVTVADWKLGEKWITGPGLESLDYSYATSPVIWFRQPPDRVKTAGVLRLSSGEEYALGAAPRFQLDQWNAETITLKRGNAMQEVPFAQVLTLRLPRAK